jgi:hypothetical protein
VIQVTPAGAEGFEEIAPLFDLLKNKTLSRQDWRALFDYTWPCETKDRGFVLKDGDRVVGFFGTVWSTREVRGSRHRFCNLSTWVTLPEYRNHSLRLFQAVLALKDCTITCNTPAGKLYPLYRKFGFQDLETELRLLPIIPPLSILPFGKWRATSNPATIQQRLKEPERAIFEQHRPHRCGHLLVYSRDAYCYLLHTRMQGRRASFAHVQYVSHPEIFAQARGAIRRGLLLATGTPLVVVPSRLVETLELEGTRRVQLGTPQVFRSAALQRGDIDNLYSEVLLFGL